MPGNAHKRLYEMAEEQYGYVTAAQARIAGVTNQTLASMATRGVLQRSSWGVYRLQQYPPSPYDQYFEAVLWPLSVPGVISHESALALYELSDVSPSKIHVTVPRGSRIRREPPSWMTLHRADLPEQDIQVHEGIPATTPERAIRDCHDSHLGSALIRQAIEDGRRSGHLRAERAAALQRELLDEPAGG